MSVAGRVDNWYCRANDLGLFGRCARHRPQSRRRQASIDGRDDTLMARR